jgi:hypothetical protein
MYLYVCKSKALILALGSFIVTSLQPHDQPMLNTLNSLARVFGAQQMRVMRSRRRKGTGPITATPP